MSSLTMLIIAGFLGGSKQLFHKKLSNSNLSSYSYTTATQLASTLLAIPFLFLSPQLPTNPLTWILVIISTTSFAISIALSFAALKIADVSIVSLIRRLEIVFVYLTGVILLKEVLTIKNLIGVIAITFASALIILTKTQGAKISKRGIQYAVIMTIFGSVATVLDKQIVDSFSPYTYVFINNLLVGLTFSYKKNNLRQAFLITKTQFIPLGIQALLSNVSFLLILIAFQQSAVSQVMPVYKSISLITPVILGIILFKETNSLSQKIIALILSSLGIFLMY